MATQTTDPFNWPTLNRNDLMSLSTINKDKDLVRVKTAQATLGMRSTSQNLDTQDIQGNMKLCLWWCWLVFNLGCKPKQWVKDEVNRPEFQNQNWDIDGTYPRALHISKLNKVYNFAFLELNKPEYNLTNEDIPKSRPNFTKFSTTRPASNPLNPVYKLPTVEYREPTPPKFLRDQITNADIDGAHPKKPKYYETRDILSVDDIDGTKAKKVYVRGT